MFLAESISGDTAVGHALAYSHAIERLAGVENGLLSNRTESLQTTIKGNADRISDLDAFLERQREKLEDLMKRRDPARIDNILQSLNDAASGDANLMPIVIEAVENNITLGEIADTLREVYGEHRA